MRWVLIAVLSCLAAAPAVATEFRSTDGTILCDLPEMQRQMELLTVQDAEAAKLSLRRAIVIGRCRTAPAATRMEWGERYGRLVKVRVWGDPRWRWSIAGPWLGTAAPLAGLSDGKLDTRREVALKSRAVMCRERADLAKAKAAAARPPAGCGWLLPGESIRIEATDCAAGVVQIDAAGWPKAWVAAAAITDSGLCSTTKP